MPKEACSLPASCEFDMLALGHAELDEEMWHTRMKTGEEGVSLAREGAVLRVEGGKESPGTQPSSCKASSAFPWLDPQMVGQCFPPKQEPVAEPDQLARPLRTGKVGAWDATIWLLSQKDSWAGGAERGLWVTWPRRGRWGLLQRLRWGNGEDTVIREIRERS